MINISLSQYLVGKLRQAIASGELTDYNSSNRSAQFRNFIFPDKPMITKLMKNKNNFPRISVESVSQSSDHRLGQMSESYLMRETVKITCYSVRNLICTIQNTVDESQTYTGLTIYALTNTPISDISMVTGIFNGLPYTFVKNVDYQLFDSDLDGFSESIKWLGVDVPDDGTDFSVSYNRKGTGQEVVRIMAQDITKYIRQNWRLNWAENVAFNYKLIASAPIDFEEEGGLYRWDITVQFNTFDGIESI